MSEDTAESRRLLRMAAAAVADVDASSEGQGTPVVGSPGFLRRDRKWDQVGFLDTVQDEYGLVVRWWLIVVRELVIVGVLFWIVAFVIGLTVGSAQTMGVGATEVSVTWVAVGIALALRVVAKGIALVVRIGRER